MITPIDESVAWSLVRAVRPGIAGEEGLTRVHHHLRPEVVLQVFDGAKWDVSAPITSAARALIDLYLPLQLRAELVIAQWGQSLDGRIATESGRSHYITGAQDICRLHRLRALVDAVVVGSGTVAADNPRLTVRLVEGTNPLRVVLDPAGRLPRERHVFTDGAARTLVVRRLATRGDRAVIAGDVVSLPAGADGFDPALILRTLRDLGCRRVLIEGGGVTISRFLQADAIDRLHVTVAPLLLGSGRASLTLPAIDALEDARRPSCRYFRLGHDMLFDCDLRASSDQSAES